MNWAKVHLLASVVIATVPLSVAAAEAAEANEVSPVVSYVFLDSIDASGSPLVSPLASYRFLESVDQPESGLDIVSSVVSYQYFDSLGDENVTFRSSTAVSYQYSDSSGSANLQGTVKNAANGVVLDGATVRVFRNGQLVSSAITDISGIFRATGLTDGSYELSASKQDFLTAIKAGVQVTVGQSVPLNLSLEPRPSPPRVQPASTPLPESVVTVPKINPHLVSFPSIEPPNPQKMTIVLTHGWLSTFLEWPSQMADKLVKNKINERANIVAWEWGEQAVGLLPPIEKTPQQGQALGQALLARLGADYNRPIHFIGHSLGTIVNAQAVEFLYSHGYTPEKVPVQITLLDEAEIINAKASVENLEYLLTGRSPRRDIYSPIPSQYLWMDNYVSFFGGVSLRFRSDAVNVILWPGPHECGATYIANPFAGWECGHAYSYKWYTATVEVPSIAPIGFIHSFASSGFSQRPKRGSVYIQDTLRAAEFQFKYYSPEQDLPVIDSGSASVGSAIGGFIESAIGAYSVVNKIGVKFLNAYTGAIQSLGDNVVDWGEGISESISSWTLRLRLKRRANGLAKLSRNLREADVNHGAVVVPISIPTNALGMSFDYSFTEAADGDYLSVGIDQTNIFNIGQSIAGNSTFLNSGILNVASWRGKEVNLAFVLAGHGNPSGSVSIERVRFYGENLPLLQAAMSGTNVIVIWTVSASNCFLEASDDLLSDRWAKITNGIESGRFLNQLLVQNRGKTQFFRVRKAD